MTDWISLVQGIVTRKVRVFPRRVFARPGASAAQLQDLEKVVGMPVPAPLRELLFQSNGLMEQGDLGRGFENHRWIVDPIDDITEWYRALRSDDAFDDLLCEETEGAFYFGGSGTDGNRFGFGCGDRYPINCIVEYYRIGGDTSVVASDFRSFFEYLYDYDGENGA